MTETIVAFVGTAIADHVLCMVDGKDLKTTKEYKLTDLIDAVT